VDTEAIKQGLTVALEHAGEGFTIGDLEGMLAAGKALLWLGNRGVLVTVLYDDPSGRFLHVWLGTGDIRELVSMEPGISAWARARGCLYSSINGRKGWSRVFKDVGFKEFDGELRKYYV
jgi:hypothetical protein